MANINIKRIKKCI